MTQVIFQRTGQPQVTVHVTFAGHHLAFSPTGRAIIDVPGGAYYALSWVATGVPLASWSLELLEPVAWAFKIDKKLPPNAKDSNTEAIFIP